MKFKIKDKEQFLEFELLVPEEYPYAQPEVKFIDHNFDPNFAKLFFAGTEQIIRRLWQGGEPGYLPGTEADINKGKIGVKKVQGALNSEMEKLKILSRSELKHDIEFFHTRAQLT